MDPITEKMVMTIVGTAVAGLMTWLGTQIVKYKKLNSEAENRALKTTIDNSLTTAL